MTERTRSWYLLLNFGVPGFKTPAAARRHWGLVRRELKSISATAQVVKVDRQKRYLFRFPRYRRDDAAANCLADSFYFAFSMLWGPLFEPDRENTPLPIPADVVGGSQHLQAEQLAALLVSERGGYEPLPSATTVVLRAMTTTPDYFEAAWRICPVLVVERHLFHACRFLKTSYDNFYVDPVDIPRLADDAQAGAVSSSRQSPLEDALQNAFKSVEAVIGDPPRKDTKLQSLIRAAGSDPGEMVGYAVKRPLLRAIREMNEARDKRSAHGSTKNRTIRLLELADFQGCACKLLLTAIEHHRGAPVWY